jgi:hypothetical protein
MNIIESIKKSREKQISDDVILEEIKRRNPQHFSLFQEIKNRKITSTDVLNEIINKTSPREKQEEEKSVTSEDNKVDVDKSEEVSFSAKNKVSKKEEDERQEFLRRIEAKEKEEK